MTHLPTIDYPDYGLLMLLLLATSMRVFCHGGHGNEFQGVNRLNRRMPFRSGNGDEATGFEG